MQKTFNAKGYTPNWSEEVFVIKKVKNTVPQTYVINDLKDEEIIGTFYEKQLKKTNQKKLRFRNQILAVSVDLSKLSDVVKNDVVKKTMQVNQLLK